MWFQLVCVLNAVGFLVSLFMFLCGFYLRSTESEETRPSQMRVLFHGSLMVVNGVFFVVGLTHFGVDVYSWFA